VLAVAFQVSFVDGFLKSYLGVKILFMSSCNKIIVINSHEVKEALTQSEWETLLNVINKLANVDVELNITYSPMSNHDH
jgi:hypothetical protein